MSVNSQQMTGLLQHVSLVLQPSLLPYNNYYTNLTGTELKYWIIHHKFGDLEWDLKSIAYAVVVEFYRGF